MRKLLYALAFGLALNATGTSQTTHTVRSGDNLASIAKKYGTEQASILRANRGVDSRKLQIGQKLRIPNEKRGSSVRTATAKPSRGAGYTVRKGDHDGTIAKRAGISVSQLHKLNPGVHWRSLQIGQKVRVTGSGASSPKAASTSVARTGSYTVKSGDNDWSIAKRLGTTSSKLRSLNPGVNWTRLRIGQKLRSPGTANPVASSKSTGARYASISRDDVNVRRNPTSGSRVVAKVSAGTKVTVLGRKSDWYKLRFPRGSVGWVRGDMLKSTSVRAATQSSRNPRSLSASGKSAAKVAHHSATGNAIVDRALSMIGTRYRYGGMSRSGTDCSGFSSQIYAAFGVRLPRTSREQSRHGTSISKSDLKAGDLVFFRTSRSSRVNHVGIYIGNGKFVHASSSRGHVRVDGLNDGYYQNRYVAGRRVGGAKVARVTKKPSPVATGVDAVPTKDAESEDWEKPFREAPNPRPADGNR